MLVKSVCESAPTLYEDRYGSVCNVEFPADAELGKNMLSLKTVTN